MSPSEIIALVALLLILFIPLTLVLLNRLRIDVAALIMAVSLGVMQLLGYAMLGPANTPKDAVKAVSGFGEPVVITLLALFIITHGLDKSGVTRRIAFQLIRIGGGHMRLLIGAFTATSALLSLFMNNLAAAALLLPSAIEVSRQTGIRPSKLLIPVAFGSLLGGSATYFTTANIVVSELLPLASPPQHSLNILDFTPTGGLIAIAGIIFLTIFGKRLLPDRQPSIKEAMSRMTGAEIEDFYHLGERLWEASVLENSKCIDKTIQECGVGRDWGVVIAAIQHGHDDFTLPYPRQTIQFGDKLLLIGREEKIIGMSVIGLDVHPAQHSNGHLTYQGIKVAEVLLAPHAKVQGQSLKEIDFRKKYGLTVVALRRLNRNFRTDVGTLQLNFGDAMLVVGTEANIQHLKLDRDFIVLEPNPADLPLQRKPALISTFIILAAIIASVAGAPVFLCMLAGAVLTILTGVLSMDEAYKAVEWPAIFLIAGMYAISLAMLQTGAAELMGTWLLNVVEPIGPLGLAAGAYLLSALLTQVMGGQVTALVTGPITITAAISMGVNAQAIAVATAIGCSASFLTPIAHPVNILMIGPANYKFRDFFRVGWVLTLITFAMLLIGMKIFWKL